MRIMLADEEPRVRSALRVLLERQPCLTIVGESDGAEDLLDQIEAIRPDAVLLSWELPGLAPADLLPALRRACPDTRVIGLSGLPEARQAALDAGADAFGSKMDPPEQLLSAIDDCRSR